MAMRSSEMTSVTFKKSIETPLHYSTKFLSLGALKWLEGAEATARNELQTCMKTLSPSA